MTALVGTSEGVSPGVALASAREAAGLSVADVAAQMRISPRQVEALEADRYDALPGTVFVRGFIRNYARVLKLDPVPLLHALEPSLAQEAPLRIHATAGSLPVAVRRSPSGKLFVLFGVVLAALVAAGGYELSSRYKGEARTASTEAHRVASATQQTAPSTVADSTPSLVSVPTPSTKEAPDPPVAATDLAPSAPALAEPVQPAQTRPEIGGRHARIGIRFLDQSWVEIRDGHGRVVFSGTGQAASERTIEAPPPLSVVVGNAGAVTMTYNDRPLDVASHAARNIARFTLE